MSKKAKLLRYLAGGGEKTSLQIGNAINTVAPSSMCADLRKLGCSVTSRFIRRTSQGVMIYGYTLLHFPAKLEGWL